MLLTRRCHQTFYLQLHCCGVKSVHEWRRVKNIDSSVFSAGEKYNIPKSCCREGISQDACDQATHNLGKEQSIKQDVYDQGCYDLIISKLREHSGLILSIGIAVAVSQFLGLIFALILAFAVNRSNRYKA